jgi:hypothetical protein
MSTQQIPLEEFFVLYALVGGSSALIHLAWQLGLALLA